MFTGERWLNVLTLNRDTCSTCIKITWGNQIIICQRSTCISGHGQQQPNWNPSPIHTGFTLRTPGSDNQLGRVVNTYTVYVRMFPQSRDETNNHSFVRRSKRGEAIFLCQNQKNDNRKLAMKKTTDMDEMQVAVRVVVSHLTEITSLKKKRVNMNTKISENKIAIQSDHQGGSSHLEDNFVCPDRRRVSATTS